MILAVVTSAIGWLVLARVFPLAPPTGTGLGSLLLDALPIYVLLIPVHELGHAVAAWLVGLRIERVIVGEGPRLVEGTIRGVTIELRLLPLGGVTVPRPGMLGAFIRSRYWLVVAGGPAANVLVHVLCAAIVNDPGAGVPLRQVMFEVAFMNSWLLLLNLIPFRTSGGQPSDGLQLVTIPFVGPTVVHQTRLVRYAQHATEALAREDLDGAQRWCEAGLEALPRDVVLRQLLGFVQHRRRDYERARQVWKEALADARAPAAQYLLQSCIAWVDVLVGGEDRLAEADRLSRELSLVSDAAQRHTRGAVLLRLGRLDEALPLLKARLYLGGPKHPRDIAACHALLAVATALAGERDAAARHLETARAADPACELLGDAEAEVAAIGRPRVIASPGRTRAVMFEPEGVRIWRRVPVQSRSTPQDIRAVQDGVVFVPYASMSRLAVERTARGRISLLAEFDTERFRLPMSADEARSAHYSLHWWHARAIREHSPRPASGAPSPDVVQPQIHAQRARGLGE